MIGQASFMIVAHRFELGDHHDREEGDDQQRRDEAGGGTAKAARNKSGTVTAPVRRENLGDAFAEEGEAGDGDDHVAADPEGDDPAIGVDHGREAHERPAALHGGCERDRPGPRPRLP